MPNSLFTNWFKNKKKNLVLGMNNLSTAMGGSTPTTYTVKPGDPSSNVQAQTGLPKKDVNATAGTVLPIREGGLAYEGPSIVDYLKSTGQASDFGSRMGLAQERGITNYSGTSAQNTQLLAQLRGAGQQPVQPTQQLQPSAPTGGGFWTGEKMLYNKQEIEAWKKAHPGGYDPLALSPTDTQAPATQQKVGDVRINPQTGKEEKLFQSGTGDLFWTEVAPIGVDVTTPLTATPTGEQPTTPIQDFRTTLQEGMQPLLDVQQQILTELKEAPELYQQEYERLAKEQGLGELTDEIKSLTRDRFAIETQIEQLPDEIKARVQNVFRTRIGTERLTQAELKPLAFLFNSLSRAKATSMEDLQFRRGEVQTALGLITKDNQRKQQALDTALQMAQGQFGLTEKLAGMEFEQETKPPTTPDVFGSATTGYWTFNPETKQFEQVVSPAETTTKTTPTTPTTPTAPISIKPEGVLIETEAGKQFDISTVQGLKDLKKAEPELEYADMRSWLDTNTKMNLSTIDGLLEGSGFKTAEETERSYSNSEIMVMVRDELETDYKLKVDAFIKGVENTLSNVTPADIEAAKIIFEQEQKIISGLNWYDRRGYFKAY